MAFEYFLADNIVYWGFWDLILPFMLIFAIVFAILQKAKIFGDKEAKRYNVVIALVMGMLVVVPHALGILPPERDPVVIMQRALPNVSIVLVAILMALLIIGLLGKRVELGGSSLAGWIAVLAFALVVFIFGSAAGWWYLPTWLGWIAVNPDLQALIIVILVFAIIIWFITHEPDDEKKNDDDTFGGRLTKMLVDPKGK